MLQGLKVSNFKALRDVDVSFPRLTLLLGPNSSGKSSVFQIILAVKQTLESRNPLVPLVLNGRYVQLGSFENLVYGHDLAQRISIQVRFPTPRLKERFSRSSLRGFRISTLDAEATNGAPFDL